MKYLFAASPVNKRPDTPAKPSNLFRLNAWRNVQVLPPYNVDLTLTPTTPEQMRARSNIIEHNRK